MKNNDIKFETLRKPIRKKIIIGSVVAVAVVSAITITTSRTKYRLTQSIPVVRGFIKYDNNDLNIVAVKTSEDGTNYNDTVEVPTNGYTFNTTKSVCKIPSNDTYVEDRSITINYHDGKIGFDNLTKKKTKCYLYFDKINGITASQLLATVKSKSNGTKSSFSEVATGNEGIFEADDPMYGTNTKSYYWRGAVTDNHVIFANYCWRIMRINGDGTIRMIYNGAVQSGNTCLGNGANTTNVEIGRSAYNSSSDKSYYVGWTFVENNQRPFSSEKNIETSSTVKTYVNDWYKTNITDKGYDSKVSTNKFCNDRNVGNPPAGWNGFSSDWSAIGTQFTYVAAKRVWETHTPTLSCSSEDTYNVKIGLITIDEVMYAGGKEMSANSDYFLYSGSMYWTMSPNFWFGKGELFGVTYDNDYAAYLFIIFNNGTLYYSDTSRKIGIRPVINLTTFVTFNQNATGEATSPYVVQ